MGKWGRKRPDDGAASLRTGLDATSQTEKRGMSQERRNFELAEALFSEGRYEEAATQFDEVARTLGTSGRKAQGWLVAKVREATALMLAQRLEDSLDTVDSILTSGLLQLADAPAWLIDQDYPLTVHAMRVILLEGLGRLDDALTAATTLVAMFDPPGTSQQRAVVANCIGVQASIYQFRGEDQAARAALQDVLDRLADTHDEAAIALRIGASARLGALVEDTGDAKRALELYSDVLTLDAEFWEEHTSVARPDHWMNNKNDDQVRQAVSRVRSRVLAMAEASDDQFPSRP